MIYVDVHAHLDFPDVYSRIDEVINNAKSASVKAIITQGITPETNNISLELSKKYDIVYSAIGLYPIDAISRESDEGIYPTDIKTFDIDEHISWIQKKIKSNKKILAIGEVGLDYSHPKTDKKMQRSVFEKFIRLSEKTKKPLSIHSRKAESDVLEMLECSSLKNPVVHCFSGKFRLAQKIADNGWYFSIPTNIVRSSQFQNMVDKIPLRQIFTETDTPYLSPFKDKMNEPAYISEAVKKMAEIKKMTEEDLSNQIYMNFQKVFL